MTREQFKEILTEKGYGFTETETGIDVNHSGYVYLESLTTLPESTTFSNGGDVYLSSLTTLPEHTTFSNGGDVYLRNLTTLPEHTTFSNGGYVYLSSLTTLPESTTFSNGGGVDLRSLTEWDETGAGKENRNLFTILQRGELKIKLGCFWGNESEAIEAIRKKYGNDSEYEAKVKSAFEKWRKRNSITN